MANLLSKEIIVFPLKLSYSVSGVQRIKNFNFFQDSKLRLERYCWEPTRRNCVEISGCLSRGTMASFRNFSHEDYVGSKIFPALDLFVPFWGDAKKEEQIIKNNQ